MSEKQKPDVAVVGDANVDLVFARGEHLTTPLVKGTEVLVPMMQLRSGGSACNFAWFLSGLSVKTVFMGRIGDDYFGRYILRQLDRRHIDISLMKVGKNMKTSVTAILIFSNHERIYITFKGSTAGFSAMDLDLEKVIGARHLHLGGYFLLDKIRGKPAVGILREAHRHGMSTSIDVGWDPNGKWMPSIRNVLKFADIFLLDIEEARMLSGYFTPEQAANKILQCGPEVIAIKLGREGSFVRTKRESIFAPPFKVRVTDPVGVGEAYNAAFIYGFLRDWEMPRIAEFANACAALSLTRDKTRTPSVKTTQSFIKANRPSRLIPRRF